MKKNRMKSSLKVIILLLAISSATLCMSGCGSSKNDNTITIYSSAEDYRNEYYLARLKEQFPEYNFSLEYMETGNHAAKLLAEGSDTQCDITLSMEYGYMEQYKYLLASMPDYGYDVFTEDIYDADHKIFPELRNSGAVIINVDALKEKNIPEPANYQDLLNPAYKGLISMPNPKSSGTGYMFVKALVNSMGEDEAFTYFDSLSENILQFTSSGSGPVNNLVSGEAVIGLGMTAQAVTQINNGANLKITFFEEGAPYSTCGYGVIKGKEDRKCVREVFDFLYSTLVRENCEKFFPEKIYPDAKNTIENYPSDIKYADMSSNTIEEKERLLSKWVH